MATDESISPAVPEGRPVAPLPVESRPITPLPAEPRPPGPTRPDESSDSAPARGESRGRARTRRRRRVRMIAPVGRRVGLRTRLTLTYGLGAAVLAAVMSLTTFVLTRDNLLSQREESSVARAVANGELAFGLTDTDDALIEREADWPVAIVFPDQGDEQMGTLLIPNTVAIVKGLP